MGGELISTEELARILHEPDLRIFDCTTRNRREGRTFVAPARSRSPDSLDREVRAGCSFVVR